MGNTHVKFYEIWTSESVGAVVKRKGLRTDGQRRITIAHIEP